MKKHIKSNAFTLIEVSIVLVIIGLIVGGVLVGQALIKAAEVRAVTTEVKSFGAAVYTFRAKYSAIPGDMLNATNLFGKNATYCNSAPGSAAANGTCNGNGDGIVTNTVSPSASGENFQFWNQLAQGGFIAGQYTGISGSVSYMDNELNVNVPTSKIANAGYTLENHDYLTSASTTRFAYNYVNTILFGIREPTFGRMLNGALTPEEAYSIDQKMDDGHPAYGNVIAVHWNNECTAPITGVAARDNFDVAYRISDKTKRCAFHFRNLF